MVEVACRVALAPRQRRQGVVSTQLSGSVLVKPRHRAGRLRARSEPVNNHKDSTPCQRSVVHASWLASSKSWVMSAANSRRNADGYRPSSALYIAKPIAVTLCMAVWSSWSSSSGSRNDTLGTSCAEEAIHSFNFAVQRGPARTGQAIVRPAAFINCFARNVGRFLNPPPFQEALNCPVKRAWSHSQLPVRMALNLFLYAVTVTFAGREGKKNVEYRRS